MRTKNICLSLLGIIMLMACDNNDDDFEPYGPEYKVEGIELEGGVSYYDDWYYYDYSNCSCTQGKDTFNTEGLFVNVLMQYDNKYAEEYGINVSTSDKVSQVKVINAKNNEDISQYFLVANNTGDYLYRRLVEFFETPVTANSKISLAFTNRTNLTPLADTLIKDTTDFQIRVELMLATEVVHTDNINLVLVPQVNQ